jgi:hypothetical protein
MKKLSFSVFGLAAFISASPVLAIEIVKSVEVPTSPNATWELMGDFCGIAKWHPAIDTCGMSYNNGATYRTLKLKDGGAEIFEKLLTRIGPAHTYTYDIETSPLPVADYQATIVVAPSASGSLITWGASFNPAKGVTEEKAAETINGIFDAGLQNLKTMLK